jgi:hypothetical protein
VQQQQLPLVTTPGPKPQPLTLEDLGLPGKRCSSMTCSFKEMEARGCFSGLVLGQFDVLTAFLIVLLIVT